MNGSGQGTCWDSHHFHCTRSTAPARQAELPHILRNEGFRVKSWVAIGGTIKINNTQLPRFINDYILRD